MDKIKIEKEEFILLNATRQRAQELINLYRGLYKTKEPKLKRDLFCQAEHHSAPGGIPFERYDALKKKYKVYSFNKQSALYKIIDLCEKLKGQGFQVIRGNKYQFSVMFKFEDPNSNNTYYAYITKKNKYCIPVRC